MIESIPVTITLRAPFATRSSDSGDVGVDFPLARDEDENLMIPGTHVIGNIVHAARELRDLLEGTPDAGPFDRLLTEILADQGKTRDATIDQNSDGREPRRRLTATDFILQTKVKNKSGVRTRIAVDGVTSTVMDGMLQVVEQPFSAREELVFNGTFHIIGGLDDQQSKALVRTQRFVTQLGALGTVGFGTVVSFVSGDKKTDQGLVKLDPSALRQRIRLRFSQPFCTGEARSSPNTYTSTPYVPGGVIKGAIARQILGKTAPSGFLDDAAAKLDPSLQALAREFGKVRISHAQPVARGETSRKAAVIPDSLAWVDGHDGKPTIVDLAGLPDPSMPVLINGKVPVGVFDWKKKHHDLARDLLGVSDGPDNTLRVRTQINAEKRAAMGSALFGIEYTKVGKHDFIADVDVSACDNPAGTVNGLAAALAKGLAGIGRGGAFASVEAMGPVPTPVGTSNGKVVAVLQSLALLRDPQTDGTDLRSAYAASFAAIKMPGDFRLSAVFVRERLAGGRFFLKRLGASAGYAPWLLTEPGATFVFEGPAEKAEDLRTWLQAGLSVPPDVLAHHGLKADAQLYRSCPYLPENGYGEVAVDVTCADGKPLVASRAPQTLGLSITAVAPLAWHTGG